MKKIISMITLCTLASTLIASPISLAKTADQTCVKTNTCATQTCVQTNTYTTQICNQLNAQLCNSGTCLDTDALLNNLKVANNACTTSTKTCSAKSVKAVVIKQSKAKCTKTASKAKCATVASKAKCKKVTSKAKTTTASKAKSTTASKAKTTTASKAKTTTTNKTNTATANKTNTTNNTTTNNTTTPVKSTTNTTNSTSGNYVAFQNRVIELVNKERAAVGLNSLSANSDLNKIATLKSEDMVKLNYFSHTSPTYGSPFEMLKQFGVSYTAAGENIAMGQSTPEEVMNGWMNSAGHKANILNSNFTKIGVGIAKNAKGQLYWTQTFTR